MTRLRISAIFMLLAIVGVAGFQAYWLMDTYKRESHSMNVKAYGLFRETIRSLQDSAIESRVLSALSPDSTLSTGINVDRNKIKIENFTLGRMASVLQKRLNHSDSANGKAPIIISLQTSFSSTNKDSTLLHNKPPKGNKEAIFINPTSGISSFRLRHLSDSAKKHLEKQNPTAFEVANNISEFAPTGHSLVLDSLFENLLSDSLVKKKTGEVLSKEKLPIRFSISKMDSLHKPPPQPFFAARREAYPYKLNIHNNVGYLLAQIKMPILFSILLIGLTITSFILLYKNMLRQKKLSDTKNEFISNITHELKTPIATVGVAIEALKNFSAIDNPEKTEEYLSISQNELQRLNLLVDKVLKLSMFENKDIELNYEVVSLYDIVQEVVQSMQLQFEKYAADVQVNTSGSSLLQGDRLHLLSIVFNLVDNALKYGKEKPSIRISIEEKENNIVLQVEDNGKGIPPEYLNKIFDKFFRVPHGNTHNAKGYGLGLSYVAQVVKKQKGNIEVLSKPEKGTTFIITLPKQSA